ncbi:MAG: 16S rRNA (uracil(1498)-N(3))-methyltransferase [Zetaproteobacteria bacterium]|nr:16S rRNA (uracil(1498)-N(3))-methyltransferase [Zetaproteobacteria bacterium]
MKTETHIKVRCRLYSHQAITLGKSLSLDADQGHYLRMVMRLHKDDHIILFNGEGGEYLAQIEHLAKNDTQCTVLAFTQVERELAVPVHIIQCANNRDKIETVLQKGTELGAASFQITSSERAQFILKGEAKIAERLTRWNKIVIEAAEQSGRTRIPQISWSPSIEQIQIQGHGYLLHPHFGDHWNDLQSCVKQQQPVTLAIGPEGGWSDLDIEKLTQLGCNPIRFGSRIMRTETAAPALLAAVQCLLMAKNL